MSVTTGTGAKKTAGTDNWRTIIGVHNDTVDVYDKVKAAAAIFAAPYDSTATYAAGDQCTHDGRWYVANQAISTAEDWTAAHWTELNVGGQYYTKTQVDTSLSGKVNTSDIYNGLDQTSSGTALDARQGKSLNEAIANVQNGLAIVANGNTHAAIGAGQFVYVKNHNTLSDGLYTNKSGATIAANDTLTSSNLQAESSGGFNSLNSKIENKVTKQSIGIAESGSNVDVTIPSSSRCLVLVSSNDNNRMAMLLIYATGGGSLTICDIHKGSNISYTTGTNKITIINSSATGASVYLINYT